MYEVLGALTLKELKTKVEDKLKAGWSLAGGICIDSEFYLQAITK